MPLGIGDLHLLIGWDKIPFNEAFDVLGDDYDGVYLLEHEMGISEHYMKTTIESLVKLFRD